MARPQSLDALKRKIREMQAQVARLEQVDKPGMREVLALLRKHGLGLADVKAALEATKSAPRRSTPTGRKVKPKYRNPDDSSQTWTGRGRMPLWMAGLLKKGAKQESFLIKSPKSNGGQNGSGGEPVEAAHCAMPVSPRAAVAYLEEMPGMALEAPGAVSAFGEEPNRA